MYPRPLYDSSLRERAAHLLAVSHNNDAVAHTLRISKRTVERWRSNIRVFGEIQRPSNLAVRGRPRKLTKAIEDSLLEWASRQDQSPYLDEMKAYIEDQFGVVVHLSTVQRVLKSRGWSWKKGDKYNPARDSELRAQYWGRVHRYKASQLVVLDESAVNERTLDRRWGWSPKGVSYKVVNTTQNRSQSWSILPGMGINGYLECEIWQGSFNSERFIFFVQRLLKKMTPYPGPRSVLLMDNCSIHHSEEVRRLCADAGVILDYLPPYSPDFSPIEASFSVLKSWIRRNRKVGQMFVGDAYGLFLYLAVDAANVREQAREFFRACGYIVSEEDQDINYTELDKEEEEEFIEGVGGVEGVTN